MNYSKDSHSSSDLSGAHDEPQPQKYPQFEEELWPKQKVTSNDRVSVVEAASPRKEKPESRDNNKHEPPASKYIDVEDMDLSFRTQSNMSMEPSQIKRELMKESMDVKGNKAFDKFSKDDIQLTTSVVVPQKTPLNKGEDKLKEKEQTDFKNSVQKERNEHEESYYDFLNGHIRKGTVKSPSEIQPNSPDKNAVRQNSKPEMAQLIDTVNKDRLLTETDSIHDNFADDNTLYHIHDLMASSRHRGVQTDTKRKERKSDFVFSDVTVKILEANSVRDGMFSAYMVYKIQTKLQGKSEKEYIVTRRYRDFDAFFEHLSAKYQGHVIPILPPKSIKTTLQIEGDEFYKTRKRELGVFLNNCIKHSFLREIDELEFFLTDQNGFHSSITKKDQGYFSWFNSDLWSNFFNILSTAAKGETVYREKTNIDNELDNYENMFGILGRRLQSFSQDLTKLLEAKEKSIKVTASFALEVENIKTKKEDVQENKRQTTSLYTKNADAEKGYVTNMLEKTTTDLKDIINNVDSVNVALKRRNMHIRELQKLQEIVEIKSLRAKKNLSSSQKLDELKSECDLWKQDLQKLSSMLLEEIGQYQSEISDNLSRFCQIIFQGNQQCLEKACQLWTMKPLPSE